MLSNTDKQYLNSSFVTKDEFAQVNEKLDSLITSVSDLAGAVKNIQEELTVLTYHSQEKFDENERQTVRLDRIESTVGLPKLAL